MPCDLNLSWCLSVVVSSRPNTHPASGPATILSYLGQRHSPSAVPSESYPSRPLRIYDAPSLLSFPDRVLLAVLYMYHERRHMRCKQTGRTSMSAESLDRTCSSCAEHLVHGVEQSHKTRTKSRIYPPETIPKKPPEVDNPALEGSIRLPRTARCERSRETDATAANYPRIDTSPRSPGRRRSEGRVTGT